MFSVDLKTGVLEKYGALCIGSVGEPPKEGASVSAVACVDDDDRTFGDMVPFGDPSWYVKLIPHNQRLSIDDAMITTNTPFTLYSLTIKTGTRTGTALTTETRIAESAS